MYNYEWDPETGGYILTTKITGVNKEIRPVFSEELRFLGLDKDFGWKIPDSQEPLMWADRRRYIYQGKLVAEAIGGGLYSMPIMKNVMRDLVLVPIKVQEMVSKNKTLMDGLIQKTLKDIYSLFKEYRYKVDLFYVAYSGGKDSAVVLDLVQRALPHNTFEVIFGDTTMELNDTYKTVEWSKKFWPDLSWHTARADFDALDSWKFTGPPARKIRWCCGVHKSAPSVLKTKEILAEKRNCNILDIRHFKVAAFLGIRKEESEARSTYSMIADGNKHSVQINFNIILEWASSELFLYIFERKLPFNRAYTNGLFRVGCLFCPMSTSWTDCIQGHFYKDELDPFIKIIRDSINKSFKTEKDWENYLSEGGWKKRAGGSILKNGENRLTIVDNANTEIITIRNAAHNWKAWLVPLGSLIEVSKGLYSIEYKDLSFQFSVQEKINSVIVSYKPLIKTRASIRFMYLFKNALMKSAYCQNCGECMAECPYSALYITRNEINFNKCKHCEHCLDMQKGCVIARSLITGGGTILGVKNIDRYKTFGFRQEWLELYFEDYEYFWSEDNGKSRLGNEMYKAFDHWGREALIFDNKHTPSPYIKKFIFLGADDPKVWGYIFSNISYYSPIVNWYIRNCVIGETYSSDSLMIMLGDNLNERTKSNALKSLKNTLNSSPIGTKLGQGECEMKGRTVISIKRTGWQEPEPLIMLYTLYLFAEHSDGLYSFTLSELMDDSDDREAMSPNMIFGVDSETLRPILQGLSHDYPNFIQVDFNNNLMENIFLNHDKKSADVVAVL